MQGVKAEHGSQALALLSLVTCRHAECVHADSQAWHMAPYLALMSPHLLMRHDLPTPMSPMLITFILSSLDRAGFRLPAALAARMSSALFRPPFVSLTALLSVTGLRNTGFGLVVAIHFTVSQRTILQINACCDSLSMDLADLGVAVFTAFAGLLLVWLVRLREQYAPLTGPEYHHTFLLPRIPHACPFAVLQTAFPLPEAAGTKRVPYCGQPI